MAYIIKPNTYIEMEKNSPIIYLAGPVTPEFDWHAQTIDNIKNVNSDYYIATSDPMLERLSDKQAEKKDTKEFDFRKGLETLISDFTKYFVPEKQAQNHDNDYKRWRHTYMDEALENGVVMAFLSKDFTEKNIREYIVSPEFMHLMHKFDKSNGQIKMIVGTDFKARVPAKMLEDKYVNNIDNPQLEEQYNKSKLLIELYKFLDKRGIDMIVPRPYVKNPLEATAKEAARLALLQKYRSY